MRTCTRREAIRSLVGGSLVMPGLVSGLLAEEDALAPRAPHFPGRAKRVIFLFMTGGVSHLDTFDPKPRLTADHGKTLSVEGAHGPSDRKLLRSPYAFRRHGRCGLEVSELFPRVAECADDLCVVRSMKTDHRDHVEATLGIHTGSVTFTRPSLGSWVSYGLGTFNRNLPSFVVIAPALPYAGSQVWASDFLPAEHQGLRLIPGPDPIPNVRRRLDPSLQDLELDFLQAVNRRHLRREGPDRALAARLRAFETAAGMQLEMPQAFDFSDESDDTLRLYGLERGQTSGFGWQCLAARRLAERGVRFIELIDVGSDNLSNRNWDAHTDMGWYAGLARSVDGGIAGLLKDLKRRGLLEDTLVVWTTEFGRTPTEDRPGGKGRGHLATAFSSWLAGGGVRGGLVHGATDEFGLHAAEKPVHVHDFHATILHLLGLDHTKLTYRHAGRDFRLTDVHGKIVTDILA
jgi:hypothetical protein